MSLFYLPLVPIVGVIISLFLKNPSHVRLCGLIASLVTFQLSLYYWMLFDFSTGKFQFLDSFDWFPFANLSYTVGLDGISLFFLLLTTFLMPICLLAGWSAIKSFVKEYIICFLILESLLVVVFTVLDLFLFYIFFEGVLIPMFLIIGIWGSRERKIRAAYYFFLYTLVGSVLMLLGILFIYFEVGSTDIQVLYSVEFSEIDQIFLWLAFFASFAVKIPMIPFHIWLPEAHVESPTAGSLVLAGILLKLGAYGFLRFSIPLFPLASVYFTPFVYALSVVGIVYGSLTTLRQVDLKKIIAYSSVAHMNFVTLGLFAFTMQSFEGSILLMLSHGVVSPALFLCVGVLYDRYKSRLLNYYSGLVQVMPLYAVIFSFFTLANLSLPGTSSFVGEFLILTGVYQINTSASIFSTLGVIFGAAYSLWLYNRVIFGTLKVSYTSTFFDINRREFFVFVPLILLTLWMGVYPESFLKPLHASVSELLCHLSFFPN
uniref:NADH-ubiquinone oxidoreductase chain 4 n=1 Tax=Gloeochaete wittrockiana TaxID=38269 RepID=A0A096Y6V5_9EUKA|nr:NADH dehydrogenase subunit 4 [Gloeochaete wittrockiana]AIM52047.1 NADH dehydrogenase subunit 4 [Gloeochaete wittrockiana]